MFTLVHILHVLLLQVNSNLTRVDTLIGLLMDKLAEKGLRDCVNLIVLADHGQHAYTDCTDSLVGLILRDLHSESHSLLCVYFD